VVTLVVNVPNVEQVDRLKRALWFRWRQNNSATDKHSCPVRNSKPAKHPATNRSFLNSFYSTL